MILWKLSQNEHDLDPDMDWEARGAGKQWKQMVLEHLRLSEGSIWRPVLNHFWVNC